MGDCLDPACCGRPPFYVCETRAASSCCFDFSLSGIGIYNCETKKSFSPHSCFWSDYFHRAGRERGQCTLYIHLRRSGCFSFLSLLRFGTSLMSALWLKVAAVDLLTVLIISHPGEFSQGTRQLSRNNSTEVEGGVERRGGTGVSEIMVQCSGGGQQLYCSRGRKHACFHCAEGFTA